jgi:glycosyltransferase involved in cell wall biosynthesis
MRLCLVSLDLAPVRSSGLAVYAERLALRLAEHGHAVTVVAALRPGAVRHSALGAVTVDRVEVGPSDWIGYSWRAARYVARLNAAEPFDVVHFMDVHFAWAYSGPYVASLLQSFRQRLVADRGHPYGSSWRNRAWRSLYYRMARVAMERPALRRASALVALSEATRREFARHYGVDPQRITLIPEPIDTLRFAPRPADALRKRLGLEGKRVLVYIGFSTPRKGLEYLAAGLHLLPPDVRFVIVGSWERGYRNKVMAAAGPAWSKVIEVGSIPDEEIPEYLSLADLYVSPSLLEGFGIPLVEALACGTPIVATTAGSTGEVVGACGILVPPSDTAALVSAIMELLEDEERRRRLGRLARERACSIFGVEQAYQAMIGVYETYAQNRSSGHAAE